MNSGEKENSRLEKFSEESGLAVIITDGETKSLREANNNSMCRFLYNDEEFEPRCAEFCGRAFKWAHKAGKAVEYECYAGLKCVGVPFEAEEKPLVAIVGRAFLKAEKYREATERAIGGDWEKFPAAEFFENVLMSSSARSLEKAAARIENLSEDEKNLITAGREKVLNGNAPAQSAETKDSAEIGKMIERVRQAETGQNEFAGEIARRNRRETEELSAWRGLFGSLLAMDYRTACLAVLEFISGRYNVESLAWLEARDNRFEKVLAGGAFRNQPINIGLAANDKRILDAARGETSIELRDKNTGGSASAIRLFPVAVGEEVRSALVVADKIADERTRRYIAKFSRGVAPELEILRLREELTKKFRLEAAVRKFNDSLESIDSEEFLLNLLQNLAGLLKAERASLLSFDEKTERLKVEAATGRNADRIKQASENVGERTALKVLENARPLLAQNSEIVLHAPAPAERNYRGNSFVSFPVLIGKRKIGVLNFTEKTGRQAFDEYDLELLKTLAPQIAVAVDRAVIKTESVTDVLTGLLNRRYLEARLAEEIKRSNREGSVMSFMMIDVDEFKSYNDTFSHPEGDKALKIVADGLKATLRGADVAARYGGEEFSILLPQTTSEEAVIIAERVRKKILATEFPHRQVTISVGIVSSSLALNTVEEIIAAADKALYEAKRRGRNNVQVFEKIGEE